MTSTMYIPHLKHESCLIFYPHLDLMSDTPLQYSCMENPMDGGAWWAAVHGVTKSRTRLSDFPSPHSVSNKVTSFRAGLPLGKNI